MRTWYGECCNLFVDWRVRIISSQNVGSIGKFSSATPNKNNLYIASASFIVAPRKYSQIDNSRASPQVFTNSCDLKNLSIYLQMKFLTKTEIWNYFSMFLDFSLFMIGRPLSSFSNFSKAREKMSLERLSQFMISNRY